MKAPRIVVGQGTLGRFKRPVKIVTLSIQDNGYGPGTCYADEAPRNWSCMTVPETRALANRLLKAADRAVAR